MPFLNLCHAFKQMCIRAAKPEFWREKCNITYREITIKKVSKDLKGFISPHWLSALLIVLHFSSTCLKCAFDPRHLEAVLITTRCFAPAETEAGKSKIFGSGKDR